MSNQKLKDFARGLENALRAAKTDDLVRIVRRATKRRTTVHAAVLAMKMDATMRQAGGVLVFDFMPLAEGRSGYWRYTNDGTRIRPVRTRSTPLRGSVQASAA